MYECLVLLELSLLFYRWKNFNEKMAKERTCQGTDSLGLATFWGAVSDGFPAVLLTDQRAHVGAAQLHMGLHGQPLPPVTRPC